MIDWDRVNALRQEVGTEDFMEVADLFLEEVDEVMLRLKTSSTSVTLEEEMHFLKGSALNLGFTLMGQICQHNEKAASDGVESNIDIGRLFYAYEASKKEFLAKEGKPTT